MTESSNVRKVAILVLLRIHKDGLSITRQLPLFNESLNKKDQTLLQELCYGTLRWGLQLQSIQDFLIEKTLRSKDKDISLIINLGLYQLCHMRIPEHAAVQETVKIASLLNKQWARGLVNAVLRRYLREKNEITAKLADNEYFIYSFPKWMSGWIKSDWPKEWRDVLSASNQRPPMVLRVNNTVNSTADYIGKLKQVGIDAKPSEVVDTAIVLEKPVTVENLPGFYQGVASVQDAGAQLAAKLLNPKSGELVLDACAAPGGKTGHLLEMADGLKIIALDADSERCNLIEDNLLRLGRKAEVICADASQPDQWWDGRQFDAILADVPCSALGVIRRHPDIKVLRYKEDILNLQQLQLSILQALWPLLKSGGRLLYCTCSLLKDENNHQIECFLAAQKDAQTLKIDERWGVSQSNGRQLLPGMYNADGFFYALLHKY